MNPVSNILVIVDPTAAGHPAVEKAALLAKKFKSRLELFLCDTRASQQARATAGIAEGSIRPPYNAKALLESLAQPLRDRDIDVATETDCVDPLYEGLIARIRRSTADLVVKDTHHHSILQRTVLSNTDWHLIRSSPVPLLLVKPTAWSDRPRIIAAIDPGHTHDRGCMLDRDVLEHAAALAERVNGELCVLNAFIPDVVIVAATAGDPPLVTTVSTQQIELEQRAKREEIGCLAREFGASAGNVYVEIGSPIEVLPRMAEQLHADMVVMGALSRRSWRRSIIGSTAEMVLERLPCDALIVKPPDFASLLPF